MTRAAIRLVLGGALVCLTAAGTLAQTATTSETKKFQVISVDGDKLVVKLPEGTREITVPAGFQFNVDGKMLSVQELKPGMAGTATITTKTTVTPVTVTEVKNGTVMQAQGNSIIVRTDDGIKMFTQSDIDKRGVKIMRDGQPATISDFRTNDRLTATIVTAKPPRVMTDKEVQATLAKSGGGAPAGAPAGGAPAGAPAASPAPSAAPAAAPAATSGGEPRKLPKTGSPLPLLALTGVASLLVALGLTVSRRRATRVAFRRIEAPFSHQERGAPPLRLVKRGPGGPHEIRTRIHLEHGRRGVVHRRAPLPGDIAAAQRHEVGRRAGAANRGTGP